MRRGSFLTWVVALTATVVASARAATINTLATFNNSNGANPYAGLIADASGNLYGTTYNGGANSKGTVFKLDASNNYALSTLMSCVSANGANPWGGLIADAAGNLYGTTSAGAANFGTVFKLSASNNYALSTLGTFNGSNNGGTSSASLIADAAGNLYGTTRWGGSSQGTVFGTTGQGTVFKLNASNNYALSTLVAFSNNNGCSPDGSLLADASGNLYGTTYYDNGTFSAGYGKVFKLDASNSYALSTLVTFNSTNGRNPAGGLIADAAGNLYGTTAAGGANSDGTVFKLDASNNYALTTLVSFNSSNGDNPAAGLIADAAGNLYGTTVDGGANNTGTVFRLDASNNYALSTLVSFNTSIGTSPYDGLIADAAGDLFGTTHDGGANGKGTVFELTNTGFVVPEPSSLALLACAMIASRADGDASVSVEHEGIASPGE